MHLQTADLVRPELECLLALLHDVFFQQVCPGECLAGSEEVDGRIGRPPFDFVNPQQHGGIGVGLLDRADHHIFLIDRAV